MNPVDHSSRPLPDWENLGFEFVPADYMFLAETDNEGRWNAGEIRPLQDLTISPASVALNYGQAIFEGMKALHTPQGKIVLFRPEENARRFRKSATRLVMPPYPADGFVQAVQEFVKVNARWVPPYNPKRKVSEQASLYIRPVMIGSGPMLAIRPAPSYTFYIFACPVGPYLPGEGRLIVMDSTHRAAQYSTGDVKAAGNYAGTLLPYKIAKSLGYKDVLYLDARQDRYIEELGSSNFFVILQDGTLVTPPCTSILPGITRDSVMTMARELFGWKVTERNLDIEEVLSYAQEAFFTGTAAVVQPITVIHYRGTDHKIGAGKPGKGTAALLQRLLEIQTRQRPDPFDWVREIEM